MQILEKHTVKILNTITVFNCLYTATRKTHRKQAVINQIIRSFSKRGKVSLFHRPAL